jgi:ABC-type multidrug transport system permease subunit
MNSDVVVLPRPRPAVRRGAVGLVATLTGYGLRSFLRSPIAAFFTIGLPVLFLVIIGALFGNARIDSLGGVRTAQFFTPALAVFGAAQAAFCVLATDTALMRERGVFQRLRGTPTPPWAILTARICAAVVLAGLAVTLVLAAGVLVYDVQVVWRTVPAAVLTLLVGVTSFAALGLAAASVLRSSSAVQSATNGLLITLAFVSDVFIVGGQLPVWLGRVGWFFPLRHFADAMSDAFNPFLPGNGFAGGHLAVLLAWGLAGVLVAARWFTWEPRPASRVASHGVPVTGHRSGLRVAMPGRPSIVRSVRTQVGYALLQLRQDSSSVFFAVVFPVLLLALFPVLMGGAERAEAAATMLPAMMTYGLAVTAYATLPAPIAQARERGALMRLAGTPMPRWAYLAGRVIGALAATSLTALALLAVATLGYGVPVDAARLPALVVAFLLGVACFAALGLAVLTLVRGAQAVVAVTLGTLLPLCFISDVFVVGVRMPQPLATIADVLPLRHTVHALRAALDPGLAGGTGFAWADLGVLAAWTAAALLVTRRLSWR